MKQKLKPCPFCGSDNIKRNPLLDGFEKSKSFWFVCHDCDAQGPTGYSVEDAIEKWNEAELIKKTEPPTTWQGAQ